ncbi:MAG: hypothetical protein LWX56_09975 [Ignavibacteria bacterium]|nr:hypothetical protein [Ignavibacteria bacterium]
MNKIILFILLFFSLLNAQQSKIPVANISREFDAFNYATVIQLADKVLEKKADYSLDEIKQVLRMKAISQYSQGDEIAAYNSFKDILKLDAAYSLDPVSTSPKIIVLFEKVKKEYQAETASVKKTIPVDTLHPVEIPAYTQQPEKQPQITKIVVAADYSDNFRSMVFPGWGMLHRENSVKSWAVAAVSALSLISSIYYINDCNTKEDNYLNEVNRALIQSKYNSYNTAYKMRNLSVTAFIASWVYAQIDLMLSPQTPSETNSNSSVKLGFFSTAPDKTLISFQLSF